MRFGELAKALGARGASLALCLVLSLTLIENIIKIIVTIGPLERERIELTLFCALLDLFFLLHYSTAQPKV